MDLLLDLCELYLGGGSGTGLEVWNSARQGAQTHGYRRLLWREYNWVLCYRRDDPSLKG